MNYRSQQQMYNEAVAKAAEADKTFLEMVGSTSNPLTREVLAKLVKKYPARWGRFEAWLGKLPSERDLMQVQEEV